MWYGLRIYMFDDFVYLGIDNFPNGFQPSGKKHEKP